MDDQAPAQDPRTWARQLAPHLARASLLFAAVAVAVSWPLAAQLGSLPTTKLPTATVPIASSWALWWTADRLPHGLMGLWDAPIFHPATGAFALSEPMVPLGIAAAPLLWLGATPETAYGVILLLSLILNGLAAWGLLRWLAVDEAVALLGGALAVTCPYVMGVLSVLTLVPLFGLLWTVHAGLALARRPTPRTGGLFGAALGLSYLICGHHALMLCLTALPLAIALGTERAASKETPRALGVALAVFVVLVAPQAWSQHQALTAGGFARSTIELAPTSANLWQWTHTAFAATLPQPGISAATGADRGLFPGYGRLALAVAALAAGWNGRHHRLILGLWGMVAAALALSVLPLVHLGPWSPYTALAAVTPGLSRVRAVWRFAGMAHLALGVLAALGIQALVERSSPQLRLAGVLLGAGAIVELWPPRVPLEQPVDRQEWAPFFAAVRTSVPEGSPLFHLPDMKSVDEDALWREEAQAMLLQTGHGHPLVNGYSSYIPAEYWQIRRAVAHWDGPALSESLRAAGCRHLVVRPSLVPKGSAFAGYTVAFESADLDVRLLVERY